MNPKKFGYNNECASTNAFQHNSTSVDTSQLVRQEFSNLVEKLQNLEIHVHIFEDTEHPSKPDAIFLNNWFSTHRNQNLLIYPMLHQSRKIEVRDDIIGYILKKYEASIQDLRDQLPLNEALEGTGSLAFDPIFPRVYAALSPRTSRQALEIFCKNQKLEVVYFNALDEKNVPYYHTNVLLSVTDKFAIVCLEAIHSEVEKKMLIMALEEGDRTLIPISRDQVRAFAGNQILLQSKIGERYQLLSNTAFESLTKEQCDLLSSFATLVPISIPTIEYIGGGSVRCMIAENFLKSKNSLYL